MTPPEYTEQWTITSTRALHRQIGEALFALDAGERIDLQSLQGLCSALESAVWCIQEDRKQPVPQLRAA